MTERHARTTLPTTPGALLGHTRSGRPIRVIAGGSGDGDGDGGNTGDGTNTNTDGGGQPSSGQTSQNNGQGGQNSGQVPPATPPPAPPTGQPGGQGSAEGDVSSLPDWAQKLIADTRAEAGKARTTAKHTAAQEARQQLVDDIAKALGLKADEPLDPDKLAAELGDERSRARAAVVELAVFKAAGKAGADAAALADSRQFMATVEKLDPAAEDFGDQLTAAVRAAVDANPRLKATPAEPAPPARGGGDLNSGGSGAAPPPADDIETIRETRRKRRRGTIP